jgi:hypothetical protein
LHNGPAALALSLLSRQLFRGSKLPAALMALKRNRHDQNPSDKDDDRFPSTYLSRCLLAILFMPRAAARTNGALPARFTYVTGLDVKPCGQAGSLALVRIAGRSDFRQGLTGQQAPQSLRDSRRKPLSENYLRAFKAVDWARRYGTCRWTL